MQFRVLSLARRQTKAYSRKDRWLSSICMNVGTGMLVNSPIQNWDLRCSKASSPVYPWPYLRSALVYTYRAVAYGLTKKPLTSLQSVETTLLEYGISFHYLKRFTFRPEKISISRGHRNKDSMTPFADLLPLVDSVSNDTGILNWRPEIGTTWAHFFPLSMKKEGPVC